MRKFNFFSTLTAGARAFSLTQCIPLLKNLPALIYPAMRGSKGAGFSMILALLLLMSPSMPAFGQASPTTYSVGFATNNVTANGITAEGRTNPSQPAGETVSVTVSLLSGTATAAGTHTIGLTSASAGTITPPTSVTKTFTAGEQINSFHFDFTFTMPAKAVNDLVVTHTFTPEQVPYSIDYATNNVIANGIMAEGWTPSASQFMAAAGETVTVTVSLSGTATAAGTHTIGLTSASAGTITPPPSVTKTFTAGETITATAPPPSFDFTFTMPANDVLDLVVTHTFTPEQVPYSVDFATNNVMANGITATGRTNPSQEAGETVTVTVSLLSGTATAAGTHTRGVAGARAGTGGAPSSACSSSDKSPQILPGCTMSHNNPDGTPTRPHKS
jgi:hypothetical protein